MCFFLRIGDSLGLEPFLAALLLGVAGSFVTLVFVGKELERPVRNSEDLMTRLKRSELNVLTTSPVNIRLLRQILGRSNPLFSVSRSVKLVSKAEAAAALRKADSKTVVLMGTISGMDLTTRLCHVAVTPLLEYPANSVVAYHSLPADRIPRYLSASPFIICKGDWETRSLDLLHCRVDETIRRLFRVELDRLRARLSLHNCFEGSEPGSQALQMESEVGIFALVTVGLILSAIAFAFELFLDPCLRFASLPLRFYSYVERTTFEYYCFLHVSEF